MGHGVQPVDKGLASVEPELQSTMNAGVFSPATILRYVITHHRFAKSSGGCQIVLLGRLIFRRDAEKAQYTVAQAVRPVIALFPRDTALSATAVSVVKLRTN